MARDRGKKPQCSILADAPTSTGAATSFNATTELLDGTLSGLRRVQAPGYTLSAIVGPLSRLRALKSLLPAAAAYVCYLIVQGLVYVGHGNGDRKIGDRLGADLKAGAKVYVLYSWDPRFDKLQAGYLEARLVDRLFAAGVPLANSDRPFGSGLKEDPGLEQLVRLSELLLGLAGFQPPERAGTTPSRTPRVLPSARALQDVVPVEPDQMPAPPKERYRLHHRGLAAEGFYAGKKTFYVEPGAAFAVDERPGTTPHNKARRKGLVKFLDPVSGAHDHKRVRAGLRCPSAAIAAKILTGEHVGTKVW